MRTLIFILLVASPLLVKAQQSSIGLSLGYTSNGLAGLAEYNHHFKEKSVINSSLYYSHAKYQQNAIESIYNNITVNVGYYYKVHNATQGHFKILFGGGGVIGYEIINNGQKMLENGVGVTEESKVIYGAYLGANFNYFISDFFAISLVTNEFYHANSDLGNFAFYAGLGIKYFVF